MCLIAYNNSEKFISRSELKVVYDNNPDGFGLMWPEKENSTSSIKVIRGLYDFEEIYKMLQYFKGYPHAWHFRYRTRGLRTKNQCHPFPVLTQKKHGVDVYMMHNGTLSNLPAHKEMSDSQMFALLIGGRLMQKPRPLRTLRDPEFLKRMEQRVGTNNKVLFMYADGSATILNERQGFWQNGIWYSNSYSFTPDYRKDISEIWNYGHYKPYAGNFYTG